MPCTVSELNQYFDKYIVHSFIYSMIVHSTCARFQIEQNDIFTTSFTCIQSEYTLHAYVTDKIEIIIF